jgi:nitrogen fixation/metabolism regulation signal transduction histidine kinase
MPLPPFAKKSNRPARRAARPFEQRLLLSVLATGLPAMILCFTLLWTSSYSLDHKIEGTTWVLLFWLGLSTAVRDKVVHSIRVLTNVLSSVKEEDFSFRATQAVSGDALGDLALEVNNLARAREMERLGIVEANSLLRKVTSEVDAVILAFSPNGKVKLFNRAAASFLSRPEQEIAGRTATELGIENLLNGSPAETISRFTGDMEKRWILRRTSFREDGIPHRLIMLSEASEALRAEERLAWQRLVRVLSHEINNSLAPIKSVARTLARMSEAKLPEDVRENFKLGLDVIGSRTEALNRFLQSYARLTRLPPPMRQPVRLERLIERVAGLESRLKITVISGPDVIIHVDPDQLEQALINLTRNAVDSVLMRPEILPLPSLVTISWAVVNHDLDLRIRDCGVGLLDTANLFVPFYTTKENGTGIGLLLSRQIVESHQGRLVIHNRGDALGCEVEIKIPACIISDSVPAAVHRTRA